MIGKTSRYRDVQGFNADPDGRPRFPGTRPREVLTLPPVLEHRIAAWDRPDLLAIHYYNDPERWWQLLDANPELTFADDISTPDVEHVGAVLLVPRDTGR